MTRADNPCRIPGCVNHIHTAPGPTVRLPCPRRDHHFLHDVEPLDAARIVSALTAWAADGWTSTDSPSRGESADEHLECPLDVLGWARDVEIFYEHVEQAMICAGLLTTEQ